MHTDQPAYNSSPVPPAPNQELTFGQKLVGLTFNPSALPEVDSCKRYFAAQIDKVHAVRLNTVELTWETRQVCEEAISALLSAQVMMVKFLTWKD